MTAVSARQCGRLRWFVAEEVSTLVTMSGPGTSTSANFGFLEAHDPLLDLLGSQAERYFAAGDSNTAIIKLRQWGESLAKLLAATVGVSLASDLDFKGILDVLWDEGVLRGSDVSRLFHDLRRVGNVAVHEHQGTPAEALHQLKMARRLAVWFHRDVAGNGSFNAGPFVPPTAPASASSDLTKELSTLRAELEASKQAAKEAHRLAEQEAKLRAAAEARAQARGEEVEAVLALAEETEQKLAAAESRYEAKVAEVVQKAADLPAPAIKATVERAVLAGDDLDLNEGETRKLIDAQLRAAGWTVDSFSLRYSKGARPVKGENRAVAEWPTTGSKGTTEPADYLLFCGLVAVGVVEAKKKNKDVQASIEQAKRYSRGFAPQGDEQTAGGPWAKYRVPFLFATNGRPFIRQLIAKSGIWFLDGRQPTNHPRPLEGWFRPEDLLAMLAQDQAKAAEELRREPPDYLPLHPFQLGAVKAVEAAVLAGKREILLAMATGTGKTRTAIGLIYRFVKAGLFRRVLFLVDRTALGQQAEGAFKDVRLESNQTFTDIYDIKSLGELTPEPDTRLHICTIQGMVNRVVYGDADSIPSVGAYDLVLIDEAHRGYNLDAEMTDAELAFRDQADYVSKYRRVLDHFDAVRIGLTATPAAHTVEIFGPPVFDYSYRQAVIDGFLVDHEPPLCITTKLSADGITWKVGEKVHYIESKRPDQLKLFEMPDEVSIDIAGFNTQVHTENFNRAVCGELAKHIDPSLEGKTLIFAASDEHADTVVRLLKDALTEHYGPIDDDVVQKITAAADKPLEKIRRYKNERQPSIAVTVELLTTGIDVPAITNLVFIRRVSSRILYSQMLGRATRKCDAIGKERFRIFDAVDLYAALEDATDMRPVVTDPNVTFVQLAREVSEVTDAEARQEFLEQLVAKLRRKKRTLSQGKAAENFATLAGATYEDVVEKLRHATPAEAAAWFAEHAAVATFLDEVEGDGRRVLISNHADEVIRAERGYGSAKRPEDYLEGFRRFLRENVDKLPALLVVTKRPRDLTRQQLRELKLELDRAGYAESVLQAAVRDTTNADIAAKIIGFIRKELLASPLLSFEERVDRALKRILARRPWTQPQRRWLELIAKQVKLEEVVDHEALDRGQFLKQGGGFERLNKVFEGQLGDLLKDIHATIWEDSAA
jgi:type I restriction enzyme, R subunit